MAYIDTFVGFNIMAVVGLMLVIGVIIRAKIKIFQSFLIPAAIIGGAIGFILINIGFCLLSPSSLSISVCTRLLSASCHCV